MTKNTSTIQNTAENFSKQQRNDFADSTPQHTKLPKRKNGQRKNKRTQEFKIEEPDFIKSLPCSNCQKTYLKKYSAQQIREMVINHKTQNLDGDEKVVAGCDDAHMTPYEQYLNMLKDERKQLDKILAIVNPEHKPHRHFPQESEMPFDMAKQDESTTLSQTESDQVFEPAQQTSSTKEVQVQLPNAAVRSLRHSIVEDMIINMSVKLKQTQPTVHLAIKLFDMVCVSQSRDMTNGKPNLKNTPENLKIMAAQCLLLASKFTEVSRIYPAEIIYQVRGWGQNEFEVLKAGAIEEYILNLLEFDLILLTPLDFVQFFTEAWQFVIPKCCPNQMSSDSRTKVRYYANQICTHISGHLGFEISCGKYMPSQVATVCLYLAEHAVIKEDYAALKTETKSQVNQMVHEQVRVIGYDVEDAFFQKLLKEIGQNEALRYILEPITGLTLSKEKFKSPSKKKRISVLDQSTGKKSTVGRASMMSSPSKIRKSFMPQTPKISSKNLRKFDEFVQDHFGLPSGKDIYPSFQFTGIETGIQMSHTFFKYQYKNTVNKDWKPKAPLKCAFSETDFKNVHLLPGVQQHLGAEAKKDSRQLQALQEISIGDSIFSRPSFADNAKFGKENTRQTLNHQKSMNTIQVLTSFKRADSVKGLNFHIEENSNHNSSVPSVISSSRYGRYNQRSEYISTPSTSKQKERQYLDSLRQEMLGIKDEPQYDTDQAYLAAIQQSFGGCQVIPKPACFEMSEPDIPFQPLRRPREARQSDILVQDQNAFELETIMARRSLLI